MKILNQIFNNMDSSDDDKISMYLISYDQGGVHPYIHVERKRNKKINRRNLIKDQLNR